MSKKQTQAQELNPIQKITQDIRAELTAVRDAKKEWDKIRKDTIQYLLGFLTAYGFESVREEMSEGASVILFDLVISDTATHGKVVFKDYSPLAKQATASTGEIQFPLGDKSSGFMFFESDPKNLHHALETLVRPIVKYFLKQEAEIEADKEADKEAGNAE